MARFVFGASTTAVSFTVPGSAPAAAASRTTSVPARQSNATAAGVTVSEPAPKRKTRPKTKPVAAGSAVPKPKAKSVKKGDQKVAKRRPPGLLVAHIQ